MSQLSSLAQPYLDLQSLVRSISRDYASNLNWCRNPQNNDQKLGAYFKPRVNILIRPPLVKTGIARKLHAGGGEILFHIQGVFDDVGFLADPKYRVVCGNRCPHGILEMLDAKLEVYEPTISANLYRHEPYLSVKLLYDSVRESIICLRMRDAID